MTATPSRAPAAASGNPSLAGVTALQRVDKALGSTPTTLCDPPGITGGLVDQGVGTPNLRSVERLQGTRVLRLMTRSGDIREAAPFLLKLEAGGIDFLAVDRTLEEDGIEQITIAMDRLHTAIRQGRHVSPREHS